MAGAAQFHHCRPVVKVASSGVATKDSSFTTTTVVLGAAALTTAGRLGRVTAAGTLGQTTGLFEDGSGNVSVGNIVPDRLLHAELSDAATNAVSYVQRLSHISSGTVAAGFGAGQEWELESAAGPME